MNGHLVSVKFSVLGTEGTYVFQNIKSNFQILFCLGISPNGGKHAWVLTREHRQYLDDQHKGADKWTHIDPAAPEEWLSRSQSGKVADAVNLLKEITA